MTATALKLNAARTAETTAETTARRAAARSGCPRRVLTWELAGVLTLMASSAAYALSTLAHLV